MDSEVQSVDTYPEGSKLSVGLHYPTFKQLGPGVLLVYDEWMPVHHISLGKERKGKVFF